MVAAALGIAACTLNDYGSNRQWESESTNEGKRNVRSFQPYQWASFAMTQTEYVLKNIQTEPTDRVYCEGPNYFRYSMMHLLPFFKAAKNFNGDWTESYRCDTGYYSIRSPWYDSEYDRIMDWITKIKMPDGRMPAYADTYNDSYFPSLAIKGGYYSWPIKAMNNLTGESSPTEEKLQAAILNWALTFAHLDNRVDYICAGNSFQQVPGDWDRFQTFPTGGDIVLRSGWETEDLYLYINAHDAPDLENDPPVWGYPGSTWAHRQNDQTSFILNYKGTTLALDAGYINYANRHLVNKSINHNILQVNGNGPLLTRTNTEIEKTLSDNTFQYARISASYGDRDQYDNSTGQGDVTVTREFLMVDGKYVVVTDRVQDPRSASRSYSLLIHGNGKSAEGTFQPTSNGGLWTSNTAHLLTYTASLTSLTSSYPEEQPINNSGDGFGILKKLSVAEINTQAIEPLFSTVLFPYDQSTSPAMEDFSTSSYTYLFVDRTAAEYGNRYDIIVAQKPGAKANISQKTVNGKTIKSIDTDADLLVMSFDANDPDNPDAMKVFAKGITYLTYDDDIYFYPQQADVAPEFVVHRHMKSKTQTATAYNTGRRMIADADDPDNKRYYLVYESNDNIYATFSEDAI
ncbi:MAG: hypothetical protein DRI01_10135, partial [Chloroflexi bacterium]